MRLTTVEGTFRGGKIELKEIPAEAEGSQVLVTFLPPSTTRPAEQIMRLGMLRIEGARESQWEDFVEAKQALCKD